MTEPTSDPRLRRWRLVLGGDDANTTGVTLTGDDAARDQALGDLYEGRLRSPGPARPRGQQPSPAGSRGQQPGPAGPRGQQPGPAGNRPRPTPSRPSGGLGGSAPMVARWLGDIRRYFPSSVVRVMQTDAIDRLGLRQLLLEPEVLDAVEPDVHLAATLVALSQVLPEETRATARRVVGAVVEQLEARLSLRTTRAVTGALHRAGRSRRPRLADVDWNRTILANLRHYQPDLGTIVPERLIGYGRRQRGLQRQVILCVDQSGSMATSMVHASVLAAVLASVRTIETMLVVFDTSVVDLSDHLHDPVEVLFATQLGGGTDINQALAYCESAIVQPSDTILVLISDLFEGGPPDAMLQRAARLAASGVQFVSLLALSDDGAPIYDHQQAAALSELGIPAFACTPDRFPDLMAAAIERRDLRQWLETTPPDSTT